MKRNRQWLWGAVSAFAVLLLILDSKTALNGAQEGVKLCIDTLIPSLFPFFVFTSIVTSAFVGKRIRLLGKVTNCLGIPTGGESLLVLGMLGGYPVGAQAIYDAYASGQIEKNTARRLLGFCNNAGPAFIFGIIGNMFSAPVMAWIIWGIHILSAFFTGLILPGKRHEFCRMKQIQPVTFPIALQKSLQTMGAVCGWVILFRVIAAFLRRWVLWMLPNEISILLLGTLELTNGCIDLGEIASENIRLVCCCGILGFGGVCVWMQTVSVTKELGTGLYLPGKLLQACISILLAGLFQMVFYSPNNLSVSPVVYISAASMLGFLILLTHQRKKVVALWR